MLKKLLISIFVFFNLIALGYSLVDLTLTCEYTQTPSATCSLAENNLFFANGLTNSHASQNYMSGLYGYNLCCTVAGGSSSLELSFETTTGTLASCSNPDNEAILYFSDLTNSHLSRDFEDIIKQKYKLCVGIPDTFSAIDLKWADDNDPIFNSARYEALGYTCMFRTSSINSAHIGSCNDANSLTHYPYSVWGRLFESDDSIICSSNCKSVLDDRVYSACGSKNDACRDVPVDCDGSLYGAWVPYLSVDPSKEVQCSSPWTQTRESTKANSLSVEGNCSDLLKIKYNVLVNNEQTIMNVYVCND